jgi:hypothetical protein
MNPKAWLCSTILLMASSCDRGESPPPSARLDTAALPTAGAAAESTSDRLDLLLGAWSADGENFVWVIDSTTILFEADMQQHPYRLVGDTLVIERGGPAEMQKTRILRLNRDTLVIADAVEGTPEALLRLR